MIRSIQWAPGVSVTVGLQGLYDLPNGLDIDKHKKHLDGELDVTGAQLWLKVNDKRTGEVIDVPWTSIASSRRKLDLLVDRNHTPTKVKS